MTAPAVSSGFHAEPLTRTATPVRLPLARLESVTKRYGKVTALENLSLFLYPGEVVALLGRNGTGKATAVCLLLGLISPSSGSALVMDSDPPQLGLNIFGYSQPGTSMVLHWEALIGFTCLLLGAAWLVFTRSEANG